MQKEDGGVKADDPAFQNAVKFVAGLQNRSESNPAKWAGDDGGFVYGPGRDGAGESAAGEYQGPDGNRRLRSYGSMTYGALKSMVYAGLTKDDPRVKAAWDWVTKNWSLDRHPGMGAGGEGGEGGPAGGKARGRGSSTTTTRSAAPCPSTASRRSPTARARSTTGARS
jgi:hypothetical protein